MMSRHRPLADLLIDSVLGRPPTVLAQLREHTASEDVVAAATQHRIAPALARLLRGLPGVPVAWSAPLSAYRHAQLHRHLRSTLDLRAFAAAMAPTGIRWVAVKGPVLADTVWPATDMREYGDLDLVVDRRRLGEVMTAMADAGFVLRDRNWPLLRSTMRAELAYIGPGGTAVDLHWSIAVLPEIRRCFEVDMDAMLGRATVARLGNGLEVPVLDPVDTAFHVALHAALSGANKLVWLGDLYHALAAPGFCARTFAERVYASRAALPVGLMLARTHRVLGLPDDGVLAACERGTRGAWAMAARMRDALQPFPTLPGERGQGGVFMSAARTGLASTTRSAVTSAIAVRRTERRVRRHGPDPRQLSADVYDARAAREYLELAAG